MIIEKLNSIFDHEKILKEYLSFQKDNKLLNEYSTQEIFNTTEYHPIIQSNGPYIMEVCEILKSVISYNFAIFRLMAPMSTFPFHIDSDVKGEAFHIPVTTNSGCYYIFDKKIYEMQELGRLYKVNVLATHTFINAGTTPRLHIHLIYDRIGNYLSRKFNSEGTVVSENNILGTRL